MLVRVRWSFALAGTGILFAAACAGNGVTSLPTGGSATFRAQPHTAGLGPVLSSALGGDVLGWDMDQTGNDGVLTEAVSARVGTTFGVETFDEPSATITKVVSKSSSPNGNDEPYLQATVGNDIGFIDVERDGANFHRNDAFELMNPVTGEKINEKTNPPQIADVVTSYVTNNQSSPTQALMGTRFGIHGKVTFSLFVYNSQTNAWLTPYTFGPREKFFGNVLYAAVDAHSNKVFVGYQAGQGSGNYLPPRFDVFDGATGKVLRGFKGLGQGPVNGMAIDSATGIMCTTTFGDMNVEFYNDSTGKGFAVKIPGSGGPLTQGAAVAADQVNHLFLVTQQNSTVGPGSTVYVYDEKGKLIESISGFSFLDQFSVVPVRIAVNGAQRLGYVPGPNPNNLQSFTY